MLKTSTYVDVLKFRRFLSITFVFCCSPHYQFYVRGDVRVYVPAYDWLMERTYMEMVQWTCVKHVLRPMAIHVYECVCVCEWKSLNLMSVGSA